MGAEGRQEVLLLGTVEAIFIRNFFSPYFRNHVRKCGYTVMEQQFFKKLRMVKKIAIAGMLMCSCVKTFLEKVGT